MFSLLCIVSIVIGQPRNYEAMFLEMPSNDTIYDYFVNYTALPHLAGTKEDYDTAVYTYNKMLGIC